ncbi:hypothetical protein WJX84_002671 [Apatococcus fuscideae]|uniref:Uncharacterized protein n=1 Tax=Apatococcus fuscideae TaxID=2026836 RepID=A0AAW1SYN0_9CHLO
MGQLRSLEHHQKIAPWTPSTEQLGKRPVVELLCRAILIDENHRGVAALRQAGQPHTPIRDTSLQASVLEAVTWLECRLKAEPHLSSLAAEPISALQMMLQLHPLVLRGPPARRCTQQWLGLATFAPMQQAVTDAAQLQAAPATNSPASRPLALLPPMPEDIRRPSQDPVSAGLYDANALDRLHRPDSQHAAAMPTGVSRPASGASHMSTGFFAGDPPGLGLPFHPDSHPQEAGLQGWEGPRVRYAPSSQQRPSQQASAPAQLRAVSHGAQPAPRHMAAQLLVRSTGQPIPSATGNGFSGLQAPPGLDAPGSWPPSPLSTCANEVVSSSSALFPRGIPQHTPSPVPPKEDLRGIAAQLAPGAPENGYAGLDPPPGLDPLAESAGQSARISSNSIPAHKGTPGTPSGPDIASPMTPGTLKRAWPPTGEVGAAQPSQTDSGVLSSRKRSRAQRILQLSAAEAVSPMPPLHSLRDQQRASPAGNASLLLQGAKLHDITTSEDNGLSRGHPEVVSAILSMRSKHVTPIRPASASQQRRQSDQQFLHPLQRLATQVQGTETQQRSVARAAARDGTQAGSKHVGGPSGGSSDIAPWTPSDEEMEGALIFADSLTGPYARTLRAYMHSALCRKPVCNREGYASNDPCI